ncbi:MAG: universal stress protein [Ignavibacteriales bacterium]|nr:universal stress protein [Ignavibacteriales bacterium]
MIKKILVATDFSKLSFEAMGYAEMIFGLQEPQIYLIHVIEKSSEHSETKKKKKGGKTKAEIEKDAMKQLGTVASQYLSECGAISLIVKHGDSYREIVKFAQEEKIDLIIISTHGRTGIAHVLMGSVAEKVVRYSPIPVLSVKPAKVQMKLMEEDDVEEQLHIKSINNKK